MAASAPRCGIPKRVSLDFPLLERFAHACSRQGLQSYRLWGVWLPVCFGSLLLVAVLCLPRLWLPGSIALFVLGAFSSFSHYKAKQLRNRPPRVLLVRVLDKQLLARGHWRADGLVYPVEVEIHYSCVLAAVTQRDPAGATARAIEAQRCERGASPRALDADTVPTADDNQVSFAREAAEAESGDASETLRTLAQRMRRCTPHKSWLWLEQSLMGRVREGYGLLVVVLGDERVCGIVVEDRLLVESHRIVEAELQEQVEVVGAK